jgi:flagellar motor switch protein FliG
VVDRPTLIKVLDPIARPTSSHAETIRRALEKALTDIVLAVPLKAAQELGAAEKGELAHFLSRLDPKSLEKLAKTWEPKRKLDAELKRTLAIDIVALLEDKRAPYEPLKLTLDAARGNASVIAQTFAHAPAKDLAAVFKSWDRHNKPVPEQRSAVMKRLAALLDGASPMSAPTRALPR